ncbi:hypothetical protein [Reyranella sp.]|uniref:hypothetical protein n=1 Tax=Reyranella sp. TaxID=1929291 RepID=UPI003BA9CB9F
MEGQPDTDFGELTRRFERFVATLERVRRQPNRREAYHLLVALECFAAGDAAGAERAIQNAERLAALPAAVAAMSGIHDHMTTQDLRRRLQQALASSSPN